jgi:hypothetical protein
MEEGEFEFLREKLVEYREHMFKLNRTVYTINDFYLFAGVHKNDIGEHGYYNVFTFNTLTLNLPERKF